MGAPHREGAHTQLTPQDTAGTYTVLSDTLQEKRCIGRAPLIHRAGFRLPGIRLNESSTTLSLRRQFTSTYSDSQLARQLWMPSSVFSGVLRPETGCHSLGSCRPRWRLLRYTPVSEEFDSCRLTQATVSTLINMRSQSLQS